jgi:MjaI-like restriction endonuclease
MKGGMKMVKITNEELTNDIVGDVLSFPKYTTQLMNLANQNSQGTRPRVVGQMSELIQEFPGSYYDEWVTWYKQNNPDAIENATARICMMVQNLQSAIRLIDEDMVRNWVEDLVLTKTFVGLRFQEGILKKIAGLKGHSYRLAKPEEESAGIDGFIGDKPVSIKPSTYKTKTMLGEQIQVEIIYYDKVRDGIKVDYDF